MRIILPININSSIKEDIHKSSHPSSLSQQGYVLANHSDGVDHGPIQQNIPSHAHSHFIQHISPQSIYPPQYSHFVPAANDGVYSSRSTLTTPHQINATTIASLRVIPQPNTRVPRFVANWEMDESSERLPEHPDDAFNNAIPPPQPAQHLAPLPTVGVPATVNSNTLTTSPVSTHATPSISTSLTIGPASLTHYNTPLSSIAVCDPPAHRKKSKSHRPGTPRNHAPAPVPAPSTTNVTPTPTVVPSQPTHPTSTTALPSLAQPPSITQTPLDVDWDQEMESSPPASPNEASLRHPPLPFMPFVRNGLNQNTSTPPDQQAHTTDLSALLTASGEHDVLLTALSTPGTRSSRLADGSQHFENTSVGSHNDLDFDLVGDMDELSLHVAPLHDESTNPNSNIFEEPLPDYIPDDIGNDDHENDDIESDQESTDVFASSRTATTAASIHESTGVIYTSTQSHINVPQGVAFLNGRWTSIGQPSDEDDPFDALDDISDFEDEPRPNTAATGASSGYIASPQQRALPLQAAMLTSPSKHMAPAPIHLSVSSSTDVFQQSTPHQQLLQRNPNHNASTPNDEQIDTISLDAFLSPLSSAPRQSYSSSLISSSRASQQYTVSKTAAQPPHVSATPQIAPNYDYPTMPTRTPTFVPLHGSYNSGIELMAIPPSSTSTPQAATMTDVPGLFTAPFVKNSTYFPGRGREQSIAVRQQFHSNQPRVPVGRDQLRQAKLSLSTIDKRHLSRLLLDNGPSDPSAVTQGLSSPRASSNEQQHQTQQHFNFAATTTTTPSVSRSGRITSSLNTPHAKQLSNQTSSVGSGPLRRVSGANNGPLTSTTHNSNSSSANAGHVSTISDRGSVVIAPNAAEMDEFAGLDSALVSSLQGKQSSQFVPTPHLFTSTGNELDFDDDDDDDDRPMTKTHKQPSAVISAAPRASPESATISLHQQTAPSTLPPSSTQSSHKFRFAQPPRLLGTPDSSELQSGDMMLAPEQIPQSRVISMGRPNGIDNGQNNNGRGTHLANATAAVDFTTTTSDDSFSLANSIPSLGGTPVIRPTDSPVATAAGSGPALLHPSMLPRTAIPSSHNANQRLVGQQPRSAAIASRGLPIVVTAAGSSFDSHEPVIFPGTSSSNASMQAAAPATATHRRGIQEHTPLALQPPGDDVSNSTHHPSISTPHPRRSVAQAAARSHTLPSRASISGRPGNSPRYTERHTLTGGLPTPAHYQQADIIAAAAAAASATAQAQSPMVGATSPTPTNGSSRLKSKHPSLHSSGFELHPQAARQQQALQAQNHAKKILPRPNSSHGNLLFATGSAVPATAASSSSSFPLSTQNNVGLAAALEEDLDDLMEDDDDEDAVAKLKENIAKGITQRNPASINAVQVDRASLPLFELTLPHILREQWASTAQNHFSMFPRVLPPRPSSCRTHSRSLRRQQAAAAAAAANSFHHLAAASAAAPHNHSLSQHHPQSYDIPSSTPVSPLPMMPVPATRNSPSSMIVSPGAASATLTTHKSNKSSSAFLPSPRPSSPLVPLITSHNPSASSLSQSSLLGTQHESPLPSHGHSTSSGGGNSATTITPSSRSSRSSRHP